MPTDARSSSCQTKQKKDLPQLRFHYTITHSKDLLVVCVVSVQKNRPLIPRDLEFSITQFLLDSVADYCVSEWVRVKILTQYLPSQSQWGKAALPYVRDENLVQSSHYEGYLG